VTPEPGTTRDAIEAVLETPRWPVRLVDTAGLRETSEPVERLGIEVSVEAVRRAAVVLACGDTAQALAETLGRLQALATVAPIIAVLTKRDLHRASGVPELLGAAVVVPVSAESGEGLSALVAAVLDQLDVRYGRAHVDQPRLLRERQVRAVRTAHEELGEFLRGWQDGVTPVVISATHVRGAIDALEAVVGVVSVDEVLDRLFATFCIGK
jgi:tRNA modification GTPase